MRRLRRSPRVPKRNEPPTESRGPKEVGPATLEAQNRWRSSEQICPLGICAANVSRWRPLSHSRIRERFDAMQRGRARNRRWTPERFDECFRAGRQLSDSPMASSIGDREPAASQRRRCCRVLDRRIRHSDDPDAADAFAGRGDDCAGRSQGCPVCRWGSMAVSPSIPFDSPASRLSRPISRPMPSLGCGYFSILHETSASTACRSSGSLLARSRSVVALQRAGLRDTEAFTIAVDAVRHHVAQISAAVSNALPQQCSAVAPGRAVVGPVDDARLPSPARYGRRPYFDRHGRCACRCRCRPPLLWVV